MLWAFVLVFALQAGLRAHDIPDEIVLQTYLKPGAASSAERMPPPTVAPAS